MWRGHGSISAAQSMAASPRCLKGRFPSPVQITGTKSAINPYYVVRAFRHRKRGFDGSFHRLARWPLECDALAGRYHRLCAGDLLSHRSGCSIPAGSGSHPHHRPPRALDYAGTCDPGLIALILIMRRLRAGSILLGIYCGLWTTLLTSVLPFIWNARQSFCTQTMCIRTAWLGRLLVFGLMTPFVAAALWARREFARTRHRTSPA